MLETAVGVLGACVFVMSCVIGVQRWWMYTYEVEIKSLYRRIDRADVWDDFIERKLAVMNGHDQYKKEQIDAMNKRVAEAESANG